LAGRVWALAAVAAAAGALGGARVGAATLPSLYVDYGDDCVFTMRADGGLSLAGTAAPGTTIPPGTYQVVLSVPQDAPSCPMHFQLQGPGVRLEWDFGGEALNALATETLQPSSTYVATDLRNPARYRAVFSTAASGSSNSLVGQMPSTATGKGRTEPAVVGSALLPYRGVLPVTLRTSGAVALAARPLKAGRYDLKVDDNAARHGLAVRRASGRPVRITGAAFVGRRTARIALRPGTWTFSSGPGGAKRVVVVS